MGALTSLQVFTPNQLVARTYNFEDAAVFILALLPRVQTK
jgi:hypothetical protein